MDIQLSGKTAIVTGISRPSGIGDDGAAVRGGGVVRSIV